MTVTVKKLNTHDALPVYYRYSRQSSEQDAYIELDTRRREVLASYNAEVGGGVPASVYFGFDLRWSISPYCSAEQINSFMDREEVKELLETICDGMTEYYNGNNYLPRYNEESTKAKDKLGRLIDEHLSHGEVETREAEDWLLYWEPESEDVDKIVSELQEEAEDEGFVILGDLREVVEEKVISRFSNRSNAE